jgi:hypothetical protein
LWNQYISNKETFELDKAKYPHICGSFDMAWQQKGSGHRYNSASGHGLLMGHLTRKPLSIMVKSKLCNYCYYYKKKHPEEEDVPEHACQRNHFGSSSSMEAAACLELVTNIYDEYCCVIERLCCDDDSSIRADCKWTHADYMKNNNTFILPKVTITKGPNKGGLQDRPDQGELPGHVPEPLFVADPNHRRKQLTGELIAIDKRIVENRFTMTRMDSTRIGKNFGYMARTLQRLEEGQYDDAANAVLEQHFDNHEHCGLWCRRKDMSEEEKDASPAYYRCKIKSKALYSLLQTTVGRFTSHDRLLEIAHGMDTNINESLSTIPSLGSHPRTRSIVGLSHCASDCHWLLAFNPLV